MRLKLVVRLFVIMVLIMGTGKGMGQVTIGLGEEPEKAALLQLKDQQSDAGNVTSTTGGLLLPRVRLERKNELNPFIGGASEEDRLLHTGLMVYNLQEVEEENLKMGINYWDGKKMELVYCERNKRCKLLYPEL